MIDKISNLLPSSSAVSRRSRSKSPGGHRGILGKDDDNEGWVMMDLADTADKSAMGGHEPRVEVIEGPGSSNSTHPGIATMSSDPVQYRVYKRRWFGLIVLMLQNIMISWGWITFAPISKSTEQFFHLNSETPVNWFSTVIFFAYCVASPMVVWVLHKYGVRVSVIIAGLLSVVGFWLRYAGAKANSSNGGLFGLVMFGQILIGLAQPFVLSAPAHYADKWFTSRSRVSANALASLSNPLGGALGQLINPFIATNPSDIPNMLLILAIITTVVSIPNFFIKSEPPTPPCASATHPKVPTLQAIKICFKSLEFWYILIIFSILVGFFNAVSSLLNQIFEPYGFTEDQAGIGGAILIVVGLIGSAVISPIVDKTHSFLLAIKILVPLTCICFVALIWAPSARTVAPPYVVLAILGASSFALLPLTLEFVVEITHPVSPEITSSLLWFGGELLGAIFLIIMDALRDDKTGSMRNALIFQAVICATTVVPALLFGVGGRKDKVTIRRVQEDKEGAVIERTEDIS